MDKIFYFGYGANRDKKRIEDILTVSGLKGDDLKIEGRYGARIDGFVLGIQALDQIPEEVRENLRKVWGDNFRCYTMKPGYGQIAGVIWEYTEAQFNAIKEWEYDGIWREIVEVEVITTDQKKLKTFTDRAKNDAPIKEIVDGLIYEDNLNKQGMRTEDEFSEDEYKIKEIQKVREELAKTKKI